MKAVSPDGEVIYAVNQESFNRMKEADLRIRRKLLRRDCCKVQRNHCFYCDGVMESDTNANAPAQATLEHLVRQADSGSDDPSNVVAACNACNNWRGSIPWQIYKKLRTTMLPIWPKCKTPTGEGLSLISALKLIYTGWSSNALK